MQHYTTDGSHATAPRRRGGREKGFNTPAVQARRRERIGEALELRAQGLAYRQVAEQLQVNVRTAHVWVREGLALEMMDAGEKLERLMSQLRSEGLRSGLVDEILDAQARVLKLHGVEGWAAGRHFPLIP